MKPPTREEVINSIRQHLVEAYPHAVLGDNELVDIGRSVETQFFIVFPSIGTAKEMVISVGDDF